jgi:hypothetical protein
MKQASPLRRRVTLPRQHARRGETTLDNPLSNAHSQITHAKDENSHWLCSAGHSTPRSNWFNKLRHMLLEPASRRLQQQSSYE